MSPFSKLCVLAASSLLLVSAQAEDPWRDLFDGKTFDGWRDHQAKGVSEKSWKIEDGCMVSQSVPGNIVSEEKFGDFELRFEWKVTKAANGGIFYRLAESAKVLHHSGLEYQVLDNVGQSGRPGNEQAGACYGLYAASKDVTNPVGEWNSGRIIVKGDKVEHWVNGVRVLSYEIGSEDWEKRVQAGPLRTHPELAKAERGHLALQNYHGHRVFFKSLQIKTLGEEK